MLTTAKKLTVYCSTFQNSSEKKKYILLFRPEIAFVRVWNFYLIQRIILNLGNGISHYIIRILKLHYGVYLPNELPISRNKNRLFYCLGDPSVPVSRFEEAFNNFLHFTGSACGLATGKMQKFIEWFLKAGNGHQRVTSGYRYKGWYVNVVQYGIKWEI